VFESPKRRRVLGSFMVFYLMENFHL